MPIYRVRMEETETEQTTVVSYATFGCDILDDPAKAFRRLKGSLKWVRTPDEDEHEYDVDEDYDAPELIAEGEDSEPPVRGQPADFGLQQLALVS